MIKFIPLFLLLFLSFPVQAEKSESEIRNAIRNLLNQRHPEIPDGFWDRLGAGSDAVLKQMYLESESTQEKSLLIEGMAHSRDPLIAKFLEIEVQTSKNEVMKNKLIDAVIRTEGESSFDFVEPYLKSTDTHIRITVAKGLKAFDSNPKIRKRLEEFQNTEKKPWVLAELKKSADSSSRLKIDKSSKAEPVDEPAKVKKIMPLPEKSWTGLWRGAVVTESKMVLVDATLTLVDPQKVPLVWKVEMKFPKQPKQEWKTGEFSLHYFQTDQAHWIEIRNSKLNAVFLAQRRAK